MQVWRWGWNIGATLFFVPLLLKNWRVYYIFHNPTKHKIVSISLHIARNTLCSSYTVHRRLLSFLSSSQAVTDWKLILVLVGFILFDIVLLTVFTAVPQTRLNAQFNYVSTGLQKA